MLHFYTFILFETWIVLSWQCKAKLKNDLVLNDWTIIIYLVLSLEPRRAFTFLQLPKKVNKKG
jgi:hypothetical protein